MGIPIREFLEKFDNGDFDASNTDVQIEAGWYDWFCKDTSLRNKTYKLVPKLKQLIDSSKIDIDKHYVWFKNNCPMDGSLYDDFRIADIATSDVVYTITPSCGFANKKGAAEVWGSENDFNGPIVSGTWKDIKAFFKEAK